MGMITKLIATRLVMKAARRYARQGRTRQSMRTGLYSRQPALSLWDRIRRAVIGRPRGGYSDRDFWRK